MRPKFPVKVTVLANELRHIDSNNPRDWLVGEYKRKRGLEHVRHCNISRFRTLENGWSDICTIKGIVLTDPKSYYNRQFIKCPESDRAKRRISCRVQSLPQEHKVIQSAWSLCSDSYGDLEATEWTRRWVPNQAPQFVVSHPIRLRSFAMGRVVLLLKSGKNTSNSYRSIYYWVADHQHGFQKWFDIVHVSKWERMSFASD